MESEAGLLYEFSNSYFEGEEFHNKEHLICTHILLTGAFIVTSRDSFCKAIDSPPPTLWRQRHVCLEPCLIRGTFTEGWIKTRGE